MNTAIIKPPMALLAAMLLFSAPAMADDVQIGGKNAVRLNASMVAGPDGFSGPVVLLTHGTLAHGKMEIIVALQQALADRGISSLAPTLSLGVSDRDGMYDCAVPHTHTHTGAIDEMGAWLGWLKEQGATNVVLAGHSRGGNQTAWFAAREPDPAVSKVILIAPSTYDADEAAAGFEKNHKRPLSEAMKEAEALVNSGKGSEMLKGMGVLYCPGADVSAESFVSYYDVDDRRHTPNLVGMIAKPVLVIAASEDTVIDQKALEAGVAPHVVAGKAKLVVIEGAGHFFRDLFAEDVADAMEEFISE